MQLEPSELVLNADQSIYHLHLRPEDLAPTVIFVGDPERVPMVSKYFDLIEFKRKRREFVTHTGTLNKKRLTVLSTGIGTDNIDIVLNELDALVNIDFARREMKKDKTKLDIVRIGTSGAIQRHIPLDSFLLSYHAIGFDNLLHFYDSEHIQHPDIQLAFIDHMQWSVFKSIPYVVSCDRKWAETFESEKMHPGFTGTNSGFYGPQGRNLRIAPQDVNLGSKLASFRFKDRCITNLEMETSGIYGLSKLLGHRAVSLNAILANRITGEFSSDPEKTIDALIRYTLEKLTQN